MLCGSGEKCIGGVCIPIHGRGESCQSPTWCEAGLTCVDGICCDTACAGLCMACHFDYTAQPGGTCAPVLAGYDPHGECDGPGAAATCSGQPPDSNDASSCGAP
jgi:hypothetical protein